MAANIVALGVLEKKQNIIMKLRWWLPIGTIIVVVTITIAALLLILQMPLMPQ